MCGYRVVGGNAEAVEQLGTELRQGGVSAVSWTCAWHCRDGSDARTGAWRGIRLFPDQYDAVGQVERLVDIVGHQDDGGRFRSMNLQQQILHPQASQRIERAEGFVQYEYPRPASERSGKRSALGHAAGHLPGSQQAGVRKSDQFKKLGDPPYPFCAIRAARKTERDVVLDAPPGEQPRLLKSDGAPLVDFDDWRTVNAEFTGSRAVEPGDLPQQCGLATTGCPQERDDLARANRQRDVPKHRASRIEHPANTRKGHCGRALGRPGSYGGESGHSRRL